MIAPRAQSLWDLCQTRLERFGDDVSDIKQHERLRRRRRPFPTASSTNFAVGDGKKGGQVRIWVKNKRLGHQVIVGE